MVESPFSSLYHHPIHSHSPAIVIYRPPHNSTSCPQSYTIKRVSFSTFSFYNKLCGGLRRRGKNKRFIYIYIERERERNGGNEGFNGDGCNDDSHLRHLLSRCSGSFCISGSRSHQRWNSDRPRDSICTNAVGFGADIPHSLNS
ncbi:unnamed protein product [Camellia sinensis]